MTTIRLHNTLSRTKEDFVPLDPQNVRMYVCGPTVYDRAHLGNARPVVVFDVLFRLLRHVYGEGAVKYARNFTDVDDKINAKAAATGRPIRDITDETIGWYHADMDALGNLRPTFEPRATDHIGGMIAMIQGLIEKGHAYEVAGHVLFKVRSFPEYGRLSGRSVDDMIAGARVEVAPYKDDPMDFVLWKPSDPSLPGWDSPWGRGRPGWHIECSAMSFELLGASFDIHGGGIDLQFPHHENEIAQSCCALGSDFARVWMHNEMLLVEGKKMSKSLGNFFTVRDLLDQGVPGEVIRYVMLRTHYRKPMDWTAEKAEEARKELAKWRNQTKSVMPTKVDPQIEECLREDLATPDAITILRAISNNISNIEKFENADGSSKLTSVEYTYPSHHWRGVLKASAQLLGLLTDELGGWDIDGQGSAQLVLAPFVERFFQLRAEALATKNFAPVDALKSALLAAGVEVRMSKSGVELVPGPGFDPAKLEDL